jgi:hypothetical protein
VVAAKEHREDRQIWRGSGAERHHDRERRVTRLVSMFVRMSVMMIVSMVVAVAVVVVVVVVVGVAVTGELEHEKAHARGDQERADDRGLGVLDCRAELEADDHDHRAEHFRHEHVGRAGET